MTKTDVSILKVTFLNRCPVCGKGGIYSGLLSVRDKCAECNFNLKEHDAGDGPAFFAMLIVGTLIAASAVIYEIKYEPQAYMHFIIWPPLTIVSSIMLLKWSKSMLIGMQYKHNVLGFGKK